MSILVQVLNYFKSKFRILLLLTLFVLAGIGVQHVGSYTSFWGKYGIALGLVLPLAMGWYWLERRWERTQANADKRSLIWIVFFLGVIGWGTSHIIQQEWKYQYIFPMCDCAEQATRADRIGAICKDNTKSYATGRGTCSEHNGVQKWQCACD
jgi:hypothetical protein